VSWHDDARARFPRLEECIYLNTAAVGLAWSGQGAAAAAFYDRLLREGYDARQAWRTGSESARARVARLVGVGDERVQFAANTTDALNQVAAGLSWQPGDRVLVAADEFPSVRFAWAAAGRAGARVVEVPVAREADREQRLIAALEPGVKVLAVSHVHWETGTRVDLECLARACRANDTLLVVDGIQALGAVPVDAAHADAYCAATFKWLLSGFGLAVWVVGERLQARLVPAVRGYLNPPPSEGLQAAHWNHPGLHVLDATLAMLESIGWSRIHAQVDSLATALHAALGAAGFEVITPAHARAGIVAARVDDPMRVAARLDSLGIRVEPRGAGIRASTHFYNSDEDVARFVEALRSVARAPR
jgi:cysteine desulfurase/selenocysteine lyase